MKKITFAIFATLLIFTSCEEVESSLTKSELEILVGKEYKLELLNAPKQLEWISTNDFVASVSQDGLIKANFVGETNITVDGHTCKLTVTPRIKDYKIPYFKKGMTIEDIEKHVGKTRVEDGCIYVNDKGGNYGQYNNIIYYVNPQTNEISFFFANLDAPFSGGDISLLYDYISERYKLYTETTSHVKYYIDSNDPADATIAFRLIDNSDRDMDSNIKVGLAKDILPQTTD